MRSISFKIQGHADRIVLADTNFPTASICGEGTEGPRQVKHIVKTAQYLRSIPFAHILGILTIFFARNSYYSNTIGRGKKQADCQSCLLREALKITFFGTIPK